MTENPLEVSSRPQARVSNDNGSYMYRPANYPTDPSYGIPTLRVPKTTFFGDALRWIGGTCLLIAIVWLTITSLQTPWREWSWKPSDLQHVAPSGGWPYWNDRLRLLCGTFFFFTSILLTLAGAVANRMLEVILLGVCLSGSWTCFVLDTFKLVVVTCNSTVLFCHTPWLLRAICGVDAVAITIQTIALSFVFLRVNDDKPVVMIRKLVRVSREKEGANKEPIQPVALPMGCTMAQMQPWEPPPTDRNPNTLTTVEELGDTGVGGGPDRGVEKLEQQQQASAGNHTLKTERSESILLVGEINRLGHRGIDGVMRASFRTLCNDDSVNKLFPGNTIEKACNVAKANKMVYFHPDLIQKGLHDSVDLSVVEPAEDEVDTLVQHIQRLGRRNAAGKRVLTLHTLSTDQLVKTDFLDLLNVLRVAKDQQVILCLLDNIEQQHLGSDQVLVELVGLEDSIPQLRNEIIRLGHLHPDHSNVSILYGDFKRDKKVRIMFDRHLHDLMNVAKAKGIIEFDRDHHDNLSPDTEVILVNDYEQQIKMVLAFIKSHGYLSPLGITTIKYHQISEHPQYEDRTADLSTFLTRAKVLGVVDFASSPQSVFSADTEISLVDENESALGRLYEEIRRIAGATHSAPSTVHKVPYSSVRLDRRCHHLFGDSLPMLCMKGSQSHRLRVHNAVPNVHNLETSLIEPLSNDEWEIHKLKVFIRALGEVSETDHHYHVMYGTLCDDSGVQREFPHLPSVLAAAKESREIEYEDQPLSTSNLARRRLLWNHRVLDPTTDIKLINQFQLLRDHIQRLGIKGSGCDGDTNQYTHVQLVQCTVPASTLVNDVNVTRTIPDVVNLLHCAKQVGIVGWEGEQLITENHMSGIVGTTSSTPPAVSIIQLFDPLVSLAAEMKKLGKLRSGEVQVSYERLCSEPTVMDAFPELAKTLEDGKRNGIVGYYPTGRLRDGTDNAELITLKDPLARILHEIRRLAKGSPRGTPPAVTFGEMINDKRVAEYFGGDITGVLQAAREAGLIQFDAAVLFKGKNVNEVIHLTDECQRLCFDLQRLATFRTTTTTAATSNPYVDINTLKRDPIVNSWCINLDTVLRNACDSKLISLEEEGTPSSNPDQHIVLLDECIGRGLPPPPIASQTAVPTTATGSGLPSLTHPSLANATGNDQRGRGASTVPTAGEGINTRASAITTTNTTTTNHGATHTTTPMGVQAVRRGQTVTHNAVQPHKLHSTNTFDFVDILDEAELPIKQRVQTPLNVPKVTAGLQRIEADMRGTICWQEDQEWSALRLKEWNTVIENDYTPTNPTPGTTTTRLNNTARDTTSGVPLLQATGGGGDFSGKHIASTATVQHSTSNKDPLLCCEREEIEQRRPLERLLAAQLNKMIGELTKDENLNRENIMAKEKAEWHSIKNSVRTATIAIQHKQQRSKLAEFWKQEETNSRLKLEAEWEDSWNNITRAYKQTKPQLMPHVAPPLPSVYSNNRQQQQQPSSSMMDGSTVVVHNRDTHFSNSNSVSSVSGTTTPINPSLDWFVSFWLREESNRRMDLEREENAEFYTIKDKEWNGKTHIQTQPQPAMILSAPSLLAAPTIDNTTAINQHPKFVEELDAVDATKLAPQYSTNNNSNHNTKEVNTTITRVYEPSSRRSSSLLRRTSASPVYNHHLTTLTLGDEERERARIEAEWAAWWKWLNSLAHSLVQKATLEVRQKIRKLAPHGQALLPLHTADDIRLTELRFQRLSMVGNGINHTEQLRPWIGMDIIDNYRFGNDAVGVMLHHNHPQTDGVKIMRIRNGPGMHAGLQQGDLLTSFNNSSIACRADFHDCLSRIRPFQHLVFGVKRNDIKQSVTIITGCYKMTHREYFSLRQGISSTQLEQFRTFFMQFASQFSSTLTASQFERLCNHARPTPTVDEAQLMMAVRCSKNRAEFTFEDFLAWLDEFQWIDQLLVLAETQAAEQALNTTSPC